MKINKIIISIILVLFIFGQQFSAFGKSTPSVVFLNPGAKEDIFFKLMTTFMQSAADDLNIDLEVIYCDRNHIKLGNEGRKLLERKKLPEYLLLINEKNAGAKILPIANAKGVKILLFNEGILPDEKQIYGAPGLIYKNWFFEYLPDDFQAGYLLAKNLIDNALAMGLVDKKGVLNIAGISGNFKTGSSSLRVQGLKKAISEYSNVVIKQIAPGYWETQKAKVITQGFMNRYPDITVFWTASDGMALGVKQGIESQGKIPGKDILIGGIDWADFAIDLVRDGSFTSSVGGHYMDGAWSLVMLYDYHFGQPLEIKSGKSKFSALTKMNIEFYQTRFGSMNWSAIDFSKFSKVKNPDLKKYRFGLDEILKQLE